MATLSMDGNEDGNAEGCIPEVCQPKSSMQEHFLRAIGGQSPKEMEELFPRAESDVRQRMADELIRNYIDKKQLDHARAILNRFADAEQYPYEAACRLMAALNDSGGRLSIFRQAMNNYRQNGNRSELQFDDLATMVLDLILERPKENSSESKNKRIGITTNGEGLR